MARKIQVEIVGSSASLERAFSRAGASARGFDSRTRAISRNLTRAFAAIGAATTGLGVVTGRAFSSFEETMDRIVGLAGGARESVDAMSKEILRLGPQVAKGPQELGEALYFVASAGIAVEDQMAVVNRAARASAAGLGETQQVADAVTSAMNAYGPAVVSAARATDVLVNTVKFGKGEAASFAPVIGTVASLAAQLGVRFEEVGAALAAQTRLGTSAETAAVQLQATFSSLLKTTPKQAKALAEVGLSAEGLRKQLREQGLLAVLETLKASFAGNTSAIAEAFPNIRALRGLLSLVGESADSTREVFEGMRDSTGALASAFDAVSKGEAFRFRQTLASLQVTGIRLGAIFAPVANIIARGTTEALEVVNSFLERLGEARTVRAKLAVVWEGVTAAAEGAQDMLGRAVRQIDFDKVFAQARGIADGLQRRLEEVDFAIVGERIGAAFVDAVKVAVPAAKDLAERVNAAAAEIDFEALGKKLGPALATALVTAFVTILDPAFWVRNWDLTLAVAAVVFRTRLVSFAGRLLAPLRRLGGDLAVRIGVGLLDAAPRLGAVLLRALAVLPRVAGRALAPLVAVVQRVFGRLGRLARFVVVVLGVKAAINAVVDFARRVGQTFARLGAAIGGALDRAWDAIVKRALQAALAIIEPFTHIPRRLGGGVFQDLKARWQDTLAVMEADAKGSTDAIQRAINGIKDRTVTVTVQTRTVAAPGSSGDRLAPRARTAGDVAGRAAASAAAKAAGDAAKVQGDVTAAETNAARTVADARKRAAREAKRAAAAAAKALEASREAFATLMDTLDLRADQAAATRGLRDDLRVARETQAAIAAQIKVEGETVELLRRQFDTEQRIVEIQRQIAENRRAARQARQFRALGLTATGETRAPSVQALTGRLASLREQLKDTVLDTSKTRSQLAGIAKVLAGAFGKVGRDVRLAILQMLNDISGALEAGGQTGPLTTFVKRGVEDLTRGLDLSAEQLKELRQRFSQLGARDLAGAAPSLRVAPAATAGFGGAQGAILIENRVFLDGKQIATSTTRHQQKRRGRGSPSRRGTRPGV